MVAAWGKRGEEREEEKLLGFVFHVCENEAGNAQKKTLDIYKPGSVGSVGPDRHPKPTEPSRPEPHRVTRVTRA